MKRDAEAVGKLKTDLESILGAHWRARVTSALHLGDAAQVRRWFTPPKGRSDAPPVGLFALVEFLKAVPSEKWPDRWKT